MYLHLAWNGFCVGKGILFRRLSVEMMGLAIQLYTEQCMDKTENALSHLSFGSQEDNFSAGIKRSL